MIDILCLRTDFGENIYVTKEKRRVEIHSHASLENHLRRIKQSGLVVHISESEVRNYKGNSLASLDYCFETFAYDRTLKIFYPLFFKILWDYATRKED